MPLQDLTADSVRAAMKEFDTLGREAFLRTYGFKPAREYFVVGNGGRYDSKAIARLRHKYAGAGGGAPAAQRLQRRTRMEGLSGSGGPVEQLMALGIGTRWRRGGILPGQWND